MNTYEQVYCFKTLDCFLRVELDLLSTALPEVIKQKVKERLCLWVHTQFKL